MSIGLPPTTGAPGATLRAEADTAAAGPLAPQERVTLSAEARRAAAALRAVPASAVRWYRAPGRARPPAAPTPPPRRPVHAAVAAYRRQASAAA